VSETKPKVKRRKRRRPQPVTLAAAGSLSLAVEAPVFASGEAIRGVLENCKSLLLEWFGEAPNLVVTTFLADVALGDEAVATLLSQAEAIKESLQPAGNYHVTARSGQIHFWLQRVQAAWYGQPVDREAAFRTAYQSVSALQELKQYSLGSSEAWTKAMATLRSVIQSMEEAAIPASRRQPMDAAALDQKLTSLRRDLEALERERHTAAVFGAAQPTVDRFREYLQTLQRRSHFTLRERRDTVSTVNFWKKHLKLDFRYRGKKCNLACITNEFEGLFALRKPGRAGGYYYSKTAFPPLTIVSRR
jgi:hypothetical protein